MFERSETPRVFALPPGVDFPAELVAGLKDRMQGTPPEAMARISLIVNTRRMARRIRSLFEASGPGFLPRIRLVTDVPDPLLLADLPAPVSPLRRRLEVVRLVRSLLDADPSLAARGSVFDLADGLVALMDEMRAEGVAPERVLRLDVSDRSGHWARAQRFLSIVQTYFDNADAAPDAETLAAVALERLLERWRDTPPETPVIVAGSTGSRGHTARLMQAVARLPQGAVVLPGFDRDMPEDVWASLTDAMTGEDHPQYRFARLMRDAGLDARAVRDWTTTPAPAPDRNRLVSLALRPAPVTDQWLRDGPDLPDLASATADMTLVEAQTPRDEAVTIALRLRQAVEDGTTAALITPDRMLTRRVTAMLDRWDILPDDSAGTPLPLSPPGRFLRHVAALAQGPLTSDLLLTLLKHPLTHSGAGRGDHLRLTRSLELHIRKTGLPFPSADDLKTWASAQSAERWGAWIAACFAAERLAGERPLARHVADHAALAERIAAGSEDEGAGALWDMAAGRAARAVIDGLAQEADHGGALTAREYGDLFRAVLSRGEEVRDRDGGHPDVLIWGTLEARVQGAQLVILAGLNEGSWPELPGADPWLNRAMRHEAGLLLPERRIGLSAHDFQQAIAAPEVWLTRSVRSDDAQTVPSRWVNRLVNLMQGVAQRNGPQALEAMRARGNLWLAMAAALEAPEPAQPARRPSVVVPKGCHPDSLSVTQVKTLIRDPYAIYARKVLRLDPLMPLFREPDAMLRGTVLHDVLDRFVADADADPALRTPLHLSAVARDVLAERVPWSGARHLWQARIDRIAAWFVEGELARRAEAARGLAEEKGRAPLPGLPFALTAKADRVDVTPDGKAVIYDYKTGAAPTEKAQRFFDKQLLLEAAMVENGAFASLGPKPVLKAEFLSLGTKPAAVPAPLDDIPAAQVWAEFVALVASYLNEDKGYTSRRALLKENDAGDFDHLARFGEWDGTDEAETIWLD